MAYLLCVGCCFAGELGVSTKQQLHVGDEGPPKSLGPGSRDASQMDESPRFLRFEFLAVWIYVVWSDGVVRCYICWIDVVFGLVQ